MKEYTIENKAEVCSLMNTDQDFKLAVIENMETYAGSFVKALAKCFLTADPINTFKLTDTFIDYVLEYQPSKWQK